MRSSTDRILTTHVGSLPRQPVLTDLLIRNQNGEAVDAGELETAILNGVRHVLREEVNAGLDVVNDGEQSKPGFRTYVAARMSSFGGESKRLPPTDISRFPGYAKLLQGRIDDGQGYQGASGDPAIRDIAYADLSDAQCDCERFRQPKQQTRWRHS